MNQDTLIATAGLIGLALVIATAIHAAARLRIAQLDALRQMLAQGIDSDAATRMIDPGHRTRQLRRGLLLVAIGLAWTLVTWLIGGRAWTAGVAPILLGTVFLVLHGVERHTR